MAVRVRRSEIWNLIAVNQGYLEFRYQLGSESFVVRSNRRVSGGEKHSAVFTRHGMESTLQLDGEEIINGGNSAGYQTSLNTAGNVFIGII